MVVIFICLMFTTPDFGAGTETSRNTERNQYFFEFER
jgi:hypothetical protein